MPGIEELFANKNFINLLAGFGAGVDPKGVGGALGVPVIQYNRAAAAQERDVAQEKNKPHRIKCFLML